MKAQVITLAVLAALTANVAQDVATCENALNECTDTFNEAKYDDWDALSTYNDCVDAVDCPDDTLASVLKTEMLDDIASRQSHWGRDWNIRDSSPHQSPTLTVLAIPAFVVFIISIL